ncbi:hypothetical protein Tco_1457529 [Tanacetum coccineum]
MVIGSAKMVRPSQGGKGYVRLAWSRVPEKARNRGGPREARRNMGVYAPYPRKDTFTLLTKSSKEILSMKSLKKQIEEAMASRKLAYLVKDICQNNQQNGNHGRNSVKMFYDKAWMYSHGPDQKEQLRKASIEGKGVPFSKGRTNSKGIRTKCFQWLPKEYSQIRMAKSDEEKTGFYMEEEVYCFTHIPKELKNSTATLQRMMEKVLIDQRGRNVEIHLQEIVIKGKSEVDLVQDVEETLRKLKRVNIKIDSAMSSFEVKERKFLGHMEVEGSVIRKFFGQGEQVEKIPNANEGGALNFKQETPRKINSDTKGLEIIPRQRSNLRRFRRQNYPGLAASANQGMKDLHVFIDSLTLVA